MVQGSGAATRKEIINHGFYKISMNTNTRFMNSIKIHPLLITIVISLLSSLHAESGKLPDPMATASPSPTAVDQASRIIVESKADHDARMAWWRNDKFGMFIHWGLYAVPAGTYNGQPVGHVGEWIMNYGNIPVGEYEKFAAAFNPVKFDAAAWVHAAKDAGARYIVITAKHHDGFSMFDTKATDYNIVKATPYGKDPLKALAEECRRQGVKFCTYYSIMDWHHPAQGRADGKKYADTDILPGKKAEYVAYMKQELAELIRQTDTELLWFDGEWRDWWTEEDGRDLYEYLRGLKPGLVINNRVGKGRISKDKKHDDMEGISQKDRVYCGDFGTPEQQIPPKGIPGEDWESCMTINGTWGFKSYDHNWKTPETLIRNLCDIASKGGNYLLNVGPTAEGEIPSESLARLAAIGKWMKVNGEAIYGTGATPFDLPTGAYSPTEKDKKGNPVWVPEWNWRATTKAGHLYIMVFAWPKDGTFHVPMISQKITNASLLADPSAKLTVTQDEKGTTVGGLPPSAPDPIATVIDLRY
jgi:alpha-L-fucosidase